ncbi:hypothetical protein BDC45DRAFT_561500 [Circinella umbellata]|nr:hypothetical protein BDC45DRAFT_561500 [Circinella umbellata]
MSSLTRCVVVSFGQTKEKVHVICDIEFDPWVTLQQGKLYHVSSLTHCVVVSFGHTKEKVHVIRDLEFDPWVRSSSHPTSAHPIRIRIRKFGCGWVFMDADGCIIQSDDVVIRKIQSSNGLKKYAAFLMVIKVYIR